MTYTVSSGTLNSSIPYHTIPRQPGKSGTRMSNESGLCCCNRWWRIHRWQLELRTSASRIIARTTTLTRFLRRPWIQGQPWKVLEFQKLKKSLNCFGKRAEALKSLECVCHESFNKTWWLCKLPARVAVKPVEELLRPFHYASNRCVFSDRLEEWPWIGFDLLN